MAIDRSTPPQPGVPRPYHFPHVFRETLPNGLRILVSERRNAPIAALRVLVRSGADYDNADLAGLGSLTADLLDEGAGGRDAVALAEAAGVLGATLATGADWDASYISLDVLSRNRDAAVGILADVAMRATLPEDALERLRNERLLEIMQQRNEPGAIAGKRFASLLYGSGPYGNSLVGTSDSVARIRLSDVAAFYREHYLPNNSALVFAGDVDAREAIALLTEAFGSWQAGPQPPRPTVTAGAVDASRIYLIDRPQAVQSEIRIGHIGVSRSTEDYFAISVMNAILGGVFNSRINLNLRERHGYTYGARSSFVFRRQAGPFVVAAPVRNEVTEQSVTQVLHELRRIRSGDIETGELDDVKNYLMGVFPATVQSASDIASRLVDMELYSLPEDYFDRYRENIAAIDADEIARVAHKYIDPDRLLILVVGNASQIREPLGTLGLPLHEIDIEGGPIS